MLGHRPSMIDRLLASAVAVLQAASCTRCNPRTSAKEPALKQTAQAEVHARTQYWLGDRAAATSTTL